MKHLKAKTVLSIIAALLLTVALGVVYGRIGLQTDIRYVKKQCVQKMDSLTTSITELIKSWTLINYDYEDILCNNACLNALPLEEAVRRDGDAAIGMYGDGCVLRLDGDSLILPRNASLPQLEAGDFRDANNEPRNVGSFYCLPDKSADEAAPEQEENTNSQSVICTFCRLGGNYFYAEFTPVEAMQEFMNARFSFSNTVESLEKIYGGYIVTFDDSDPNHRLYHKSPILDETAETLRDLGIDPDTPSDSVDIIEVNGKRCVYALSGIITDPDPEMADNERIVFIVPIDNLAIHRIPRLVIASCTSFLFLITAVCWVMSGIRVFHRPAITVQQRRQYGVERMRRALIALGLAGVLCVGLMTFFINCLMQLYTATENNLNLLDRINAVISETRNNAQRVTEQHDEIHVDYGRHIADLLARNTGLKTPEMLGRMCEIVGADYLMIYDDQGREVMSNAPFVNLTFSHDKDSPSYDFRLLLSGVSSVVHEAAMDELTRLERQLIGVSMDDGNISDGYGALIIAVMPNTQYDNAMTLDQLMQAMTPSDGLCLGLDPENGNIRHASDPTLIGENAFNLGMTSQDAQSGIMDHFSLNGQRWYSCTSNDGELIYHSAVQANAIYRHLPITALLFSGCFLVGFALLSLLLMWGYTDKSMDEDGPEVVEDEAALAQRITHTRQEANSPLDIVVEHLRLNHIGQTPERRTRFVFSLTAGILLIGVLASLQISDGGQERFLILNYVLNGKWTPGVNLFAFARILFLTLSTTVAIMGLQLVTGVVCSLLQKRAETIVRLASSILQYVAVLSLFFTSFDSLGFDTRALLASVGVLSLTVSLGAKDLVADVLAGITIAFSDEYQIGDFIQINDFRGWVQEIGVRTTTLVNNDGNIKHFSNRDVRNILNLSRRNCQYTINVTIAGDASLKEVEEILSRELPRIGESTPEIINGPEYKGVKGFSINGVIISISAECKEHNYGKVRSKINREIRLILEENGIVIKG